MLDHAREAVAMIAGKERADLKQERMLELALVRLVEIIGEAAARVDPDVQGGHPSIPWRQVVGMRGSSMVTTALTSTYCGTQLRTTCRH